jgi:hypothetical protein
MAANAGNQDATSARGSGASRLLAFTCFVSLPAFSLLCSLDVLPSFTPGRGPLRPRREVQNKYDATGKVRLKGRIVVEGTRKDSVSSLFVRVPPRVRARTPQASRKIARRILGKNPTSPMAIAGMKNYFQAPRGLMACPGANQNGVRRGRRILVQNHPLLSRPGRGYIALQQPGSANCAGA